MSNVKTVGTFQPNGLKIGEISRRNIVSNMKTVGTTVVQDAVVYERKNVNQYTIRLIPDEEDGGYSVTCDQIPAVHSQGRTLTSALRNVADAIELCMEFDAEQKNKAERGEHP